MEHTGAQAGQPQDDGYQGDTPAPVPAPTWRRRLFIDRPADLRAFAHDLADAAVLAIDAEFVQNYHRRGPEDPSHRLTLLQFAFDNDYRVSYVVDALRLNDLSPLQEPLERATLLKLFHGMSSDVRVLASRGLTPRHTLDLEAVSRSLFGQRESGLQAMLRRATGERLDKSLQRADWSRRPLTPAMVAYAARDAEVTYVLYHWFRANYPDATHTFEVVADEPPAGVAVWLRPYLDNGRGGKPIDITLAEAGLDNNIDAQIAALRQALGADLRPNQRARVMRLITDLELRELAPDLRAYLTSSASEERAGAARALGRLHAFNATEAIRALLHDPVQDVRQAAQTALGFLEGGVTARPALRSERRNGHRIWTTSQHGAEPAAEPAPSEPWRAALRAHFALPDDNGGA
ncbi:MAG TPA: HEAT repeat domain-containing protein [Ktedonobacterales bacterium]|nr:HEAT repeat domain-containing protein [Ktedonobacterales bacterium]